MAKTQSNIEKFLALSDKDKAAEIDRFESGKVKGKPLTAKQSAHWKKVQASLKSEHVKRGRPVTGKGVEVISLSVEKTLLQRADKQAKREGISRAALIARGLQAVLIHAS